MAEQVKQTVLRFLSAVAPMRGRGYGRPGMATGGRHDPFRSRPPNTSRPPSMHVDDFVKMESQQNQQVKMTTL